MQIARRNFSLVARCSLKFNRCSLLVAKSLVTRCRLCSLVAVEIARCQKSFVTRCRSCSLQKCTRYSLQKLLVAKNHSLLVAKFARYSLQKVTRYSLQNSLVIRCKICLLLLVTSHLLLRAKNHSSHAR